MEGVWFEEEKSSCSKRAILALLSFSSAISFSSNYGFAGLRLRSLLDVVNGSPVQVRNLQQLKERWQQVFDTEQPHDGMPWLLAADRGLLGRPLALLLQRGPEAAVNCRQRGWVPLALEAQWPLDWLAAHLVGPLLPEIALVTEATQLPQRPINGPARLPSLPGWERQDLRLLASSSGLHADGWLETMPAGN